MFKLSWVLGLVLVLGSAGCSNAGEPAGGSGAAARGSGAAPGSTGPIPVSSPKTTKRAPVAPCKSASLAREGDAKAGQVNLLHRTAAVLIGGEPEWTALATGSGSCIARITAAQRLGLALPAHAIVDAIDITFAKPAAAIAGLTMVATIGKKTLGRWTLDKGHPRPFASLPLGGVPGGREPIFVELSGRPVCLAGLVARGRSAKLVPGHTYDPTWLEDGRLPRLRCSPPLRPYLRLASGWGNQLEYACVDGKGVKNGRTVLLSPQRKVLGVVGTGMARASGPGAKMGPPVRTRRTRRRAYGSPPPRVSASSSTMTTSERRFRRSKSVPRSTSRSFPRRCVGCCRRRSSIRVTSPR